MQVFAEIFREYDIRGVVDVHLTPEFAEHLGKAIGTTLRRGGGTSLVVGRDCRLSGGALGEALMAGGRSTGCDTIDIGVVPTPVQYWAIHHLKASGGVCITGSHNPPEYNGFKLTLLDHSLHGADILALRTMIESEDYETGEGQGFHQGLLSVYIDELANQLKPIGRSLKLVVDAGNGTGGLTAVELFARMGCDVVPLFCEPDGNFPNHHPDPSEEKNLVDLRAAVKEHQADLGFAFDGDADRIGVIDRHGTIIWGDRLMILLARAVLEEEPGAVIIAEVKCSKILYDDIASHGGRPIMWKAGHSLIKSKMKEEGAALAGEMSGHIFFKHRYYGFDDATYAGARLLELLGDSDLHLDEMLAEIPEMVSTPEIRVDCPEDIKFELVREVTAAFQARAEDEGFGVVDIDGARVEWEDGWGLVRCSNTQPILVLRFEAVTQERLDEIQHIIHTEIETQRARLT